MSDTARQAFLGFAGAQPADESGSISLHETSPAAPAFSPNSCHRRVDPAMSPKSCNRQVEAFATPSATPAMTPNSCYRQVDTFGTPSVVPVVSPHSCQREALQIGKDLEASGISGESIVNFGKFRGKTFSEVLQTQSSYVAWACKQESPDGGLKQFVDYCRQQAAARSLPVVPTPCSTRNKVRAWQGTEASKVQHDMGIELDADCPDAKRRRMMPEAMVYDYYVFLDGSCPNNRNVTVNNRAGFGVAIFANNSRLDDTPENRKVIQVEANLVEKLHGPVVSDKFSDFFIGSEKGSNNTGELSGLVESLLWLIEFAAGKNALLMYDSGYAAKACCGRNKIEKNRELATFGKYLYHTARGTGIILNLEHVKGHSNNVGNDLADRLANEGACSGAFCNGGRFSLGAKSTTKNMFADFVKTECSIPQFYCECTVGGCVGKADKRIVKEGVNAGKAYWKCATGSCGFFSWD